MALPFPFSKIIYPFLKLINKNQQHAVISRPESAAARSNGLFHNFSVRSLNGKELHLSSFKGKNILLVNTASACGYTHQYAGLEKLYQQQQGKLVILAFPSNDFGNQEPGTADEIADFCKNKYHITFPVIEKTHVVGPGANQVYHWLSDKNQNGWNSAKPSWNFCKYLVDGQGELQAFFTCKTDPLGKEIAAFINPNRDE